MPEYKIHNKQEKNYFDKLIQLNKDFNIGNNIYSIDNDKIIYGNYIFSKSDDVFSDIKEENYTMDKHGAPWFNTFRGEQLSDESVAIANWSTLVDKVRRQFFKEHSLIVYKEIQLDANERKKHFQEHAQKMQTIMTQLFSIGGNLQYKPVANSYKRYFGINMKLLLDAGEPIPILARLYVSLVNDRLTLVKKDFATKINDTLKQINTTSAGSIENERNVSFDQINQLIKQPFTNLYDYLTLSEDDEKVIQDLKSRGIDGTVEISIKAMEALSVTVADVSSVSYQVLNNERPIVKVSFDANSLDAYCLNCPNEDPMIVANEINYQTEDSNGSIKLDFTPDSKNLILIEDGQSFYATSEEGKEIIEKLKDSSDISRHLITVTCEKNKCHRLVCDLDRVDVAVDLEGTIVRKCANCPRIENFIETKEGYYDTNLVVYDVNSKQFVPKEKDKVRECSVCHRLHSTQQAVCATCKRLEEPTAVEKKLYSKYAAMIPLHIRMNAAKKCAAEDEEMIIFKVGKDYYGMDKAKLVSDESGFESATLL